MILLNNDNFAKEVLEEKTLPVLVYLSAAWCGPCQMVAPIIEELAIEYQSKVKICKLNVDEGQDLAGKYGVMSVPAFIIFKKGQVVKQFTGARTKEGMKEEIDSVISK